MPPLLTREDLCKLFNISKSALHRWIQRGRIPPADVRLGPRCPRWKRETIEKLLQTVHVGLC